MKYLFSLLVGGATAAAATLVHLTLAPYGLILGLVGTFTAIWSVGRKFGKRRYKVVASFGWFVILMKGALFGVGQEILIQGDVLGTSLLLGGILTLVAAVAAKS